MSNATYLIKTVLTEKDRQTLLNALDFAATNGSEEYRDRIKRLAVTLDDAIKLRTVADPCFAESEKG